MDTTRKLSASTITGFFQSDEENKSQGDADRRSIGVQQPRHPELQQLYPPGMPPFTGIPPPPGYYPYYPQPPFLPLSPTISYLYLDFIKQFCTNNYLPRYEDLIKENKSNNCQSKTNNSMQHEVERKGCDRSHLNDEQRGRYSHLCTSCEDHFRCSCCSKPFTMDKPVANNHICVPQSCCPFVHPLLTHSHSSQSPMCNCACQKQKDTKHKKRSKQTSNKNKSHQSCSQCNNGEITERNSHHSTTTIKGKTSKRTYRKDDSEESNSDSDENCSQEEKGENYDLNSSEERKSGMYAGEGDENKCDSSAKKPELKNRVRKTRRSLAYFINV